MSPDMVAMLMPVLIGSGVLFVIALLGNLISFSGRYTNALVTALVYAAIYGALIYMVDTSVLPPEVASVGRRGLAELVILSAIIVFVIGFAANMLSFSNRFVNALVTAVIFAVAFGLVLFLTGGVPPAAGPQKV